ncbi:isoleucine--tRNA ligase [Candidatus Woesearchaeota archaeon]|nr:isoleucine--tRNA ligase [Candidatus Woesearchaeota archaeon]
MYDFKTVESNVFRFWQEKKILDRLRKSLKGKKKFFFLDGPPYTSGRIHLGTAWNQVLKDEALRYKRMRGFDVWDRGGYDMHGLPTEHKVQAKFKLEDKNAIQEFGLSRYIDECKKFSLEMMEQMNKDFDRLAVSLDHVNPYMPISKEYIEGEWWLIKKAHENKRLYLGNKVMTWCYSCETALAKHELEYKNVEDDSIFVKFKVEGKTNEYLIIWTTTPWTIVYNLGVMANPELDYVRARVGDEVWILAKSLASLVIPNFTNYKLDIIEEFKGTKLQGLKYVHPFYDALKEQYDEIKKKSKKAFTVVMSKDYVDLSAGTGLVHMAPGCGPEDYEVGAKNGIPAFNNLTEKGYYPKDMGEFSGLNAKKDNQKFTHALEQRGVLIASTKVEHDYAHCWRCKQPVIFRVTDQWFFKVEDLIPKMIRQSNKIKYTPPEIKDRYQLWIKNLKDNSITRQRDWGTPLPIWQCKECKDYIVIGSEEELEKLSGKKPKDLHKPLIDEVKIKCKCGAMKERLPDIIDVWVDSGTASWNCLHYPNIKEHKEHYWPADLILEATEQTRLWFYMLQLASNIALGENCYKAMYTHGMLRDVAGVKMSKSLGNIISPEEVLDKYGVDTMRMYTIMTPAGEDMSFSWEEIKLKYRELDVLLNITNYLVDYADKLPKAVPKDLNIEDRWMLSRLNSTIKECTELLDEYWLDKSPHLVSKLFLDLSRGYIQYTRHRTADKTVFKIIYETLLSTLKMFSITCPYITEHLYQKMKAKYGLEEESVHMCAWPKYNEKMIDKKLEADMEEASKIIQEILAQREKAQIGVRWPLKKAHVLAKSIEGIKPLKDIIQTQTNIKDLALEEGQQKVELDVTITPELEAEGFARELTRRIQAFRKKAGLKMQDQIELAIITDYNLARWEKEIQQKVGAKKISITPNKLTEEFQNKSKEQIKERTFEIMFNVL